MKKTHNRGPYITLSPLPNSSMKILSINIHGLGGQAKNLALKRPVDLNQHDFLLIQETMEKGDPLVIKLRKFLGNWDFLVADSHGLYGGLITGWNHNLSLMNSFSFS